MRFRNCLAATVTLIFAASCGGNSTSDANTTSDSTTAMNDTAITSTVPIASTVPIPDSIKTSFQAKYPTATNVNWNRYQPMNTIDWEWSGWPAMDSGDYVANFSLDNTENWAWYDNKNNWIGTVSSVKNFESLPAAVSKVVKSNFDGYTITSVDKEFDHKRTAYEIKMEKGTDRMKALIAENGSIIKKKAIVDGEKTKEKNL